MSNRHKQSNKSIGVSSQMEATPRAACNTRWVRAQQHSSQTKLTSGFSHSGSFVRQKKNIRSRDGAMLIESPHPIPPYAVRRRLPVPSDLRQALHNHGSRRWNCHSWARHSSLPFARTVARRSSERCDVTPCLSGLFFACSCFLDVEY